MEAEKVTHSYILLLFANGAEYRVTPRSLCRGITNKGIRPDGFIWHHQELVFINESLIGWIIAEFIPCFNSNDFKWAASCATLTPELQQILQRH